MREADGKTLDLFEIRCLRDKLIKGIRVGSKNVRRRTEVERKLPDKLDQKVLSWLGHIIGMDEDRITEVWQTEVSEVRVK